MVVFQQFGLCIVRYHICIVRKQPFQPYNKAVAELFFQSQHFPEKTETFRTFIWAPLGWYNCLLLYSIGFYRLVSLQTKGNLGSKCHYCCFWDVDIIRYKCEHLLRGVFPGFYNKWFLISSKGIANFIYMEIF